MSRALEHQRFETLKSVSIFKRLIERKDFAGSRNSGIFVQTRGRTELDFYS